MTNGDRLRNMTDEELADFISAIRCCASYNDVSCGYPFCKAANGGICRGIEEFKDKNIISWVKKEARG